MKKLVKSGDLRYDVAQERTALRFSKLQAALKKYDNAKLVGYHKQRKEWETRQKAREEANDTLGDDKEEDESVKFDPTLPLDFQIPRGLYVFGGVGTGKSMLMDMFFERVKISKKRRVHFHAFMEEVHQRIHALKMHDLEEKGRDFHIDVSENNNPIIRVAEQLASEVSLLCFDEFQVTDVADALILRQLFSTLFKCGTVVVATSNRPPSALYEGGINWHYFQPFIGLLEHHCIVHKLQSTHDYRKLLSRDMDNFFFVGPEKYKMYEVFENLLGGREAVSMRLSVSFQRQIVVERAHPDGLACTVSFAEFCQRDVGAADYRAVAQAFPVVMLEDIPQLNLTQHNEARRFITLVDELYEQKCVLMCTADYPPEELFLNQHQYPSLPSAIEIKVGEAFGIDVAQSLGKPVGSLASVRELSFAFQRASSRLSEMCSAKWWEQAVVR